jgi:hypothetical protein
MHFKNESMLDRMIRAFVGTILLLVAYTQLSGWTMIASYVVSIVLLTTALTGFCALYKVFGINTYHPKEND